MGTDEKGISKTNWQVGAPWFVTVAVVLVGMLGGILLSRSGRLESSTILQWLVALLPGSIILTQWVYLVSSRRKQYRQALGPMDVGEVNRLEDLYFGTGPLTFRYAAPAILVTVLCATIIAALVNPTPSLPWLYREFTTSAGGDSGKNSSQPGISNPSGAPAAVTGDVGSTGTAPAGTKTDTPTITAYWPKEGWRRQTLRGAALGFLGAYVYLLLMLTNRALQRDITTGIATWAAAMPVLGLLMGGVAALIISSAMGSTDTSWTRDAIFFVAGMLPRQFAAFVQSGVQKMFQQSSSPANRTLLLTTLRGVGPDVAARLEEEGIHDVSALAYASPHQLIRATTYSPRQIVDWIDEALLIATVPANSDALEKAGVTGALDLAWYHDHQDAIPALAAEIKLDAPLLGAIVARLWEDAQVDDLRQLYWDRTSVTDFASLKYRFRSDSTPDARETLVAEIKAIAGVRSVKVEDVTVTIDVDLSQREAIETQLRGKSSIEPQS